MSGRSTRRAVLQRGAAIAVGVALGTSYVRPSIRSVELHEVAYASADPSAPAPRGGAPTRTPTPTVVVPMNRAAEPPSAPAGYAGAPPATGGTTASAPARTPTPTSAAQPPAP